MKKSIKEVCDQINFDIETHAKSKIPMAACYVDQSFPVMLIIAYKYADNPK